MLPGPPCRLTCPHCGRHKYIESLMSGNTLTGTVWSDSKKDYPMLPSTSPIQRCPQCGAYYFYDEGKPVELNEKEFRKMIKVKGLPEEEIERQYRGALYKWRKEAVINGFGNLNEQESREAYESLYSKSLSRRKKTSLLITRFYAFNDKYLRNGGTLPPGLQSLQEDFVYKIMNLFPDDTILIAELYREIGQFDKATELLRGAVASGLDEKSLDVARMILEHAEDNDRSVFILFRW